MPVGALHYGPISIPLPGVIAISSIFIVCGLVLIYMGLTAYRQKRKVRNIQKSKVNSAQAGLVKLSGTAQSLKPGKSPVNGDACVFWMVTGWFFYEGGSDNKYRQEWREIFYAQQQDPFFIADETGRMLVMPEGAGINIPSHSSYEGYLRPKHAWEVLVDGRVPKFIESLDENSRARFLKHEGNQIRVTEHIIQENDPLFVFGTATQVDIGSNNESRNILVVRKDPTDMTLYIANTDKGYTDNLSIAVWTGLIFGFAIIAFAVYIVLRQLGF